MRPRCRSNSDAHRVVGTATGRFAIKRIRANVEGKGFRFLRVSLCDTGGLPSLKPGSPLSRRNHTVARDRASWFTSSGYETAHTTRTLLYLGPHVSGRSFRTREKLRPQNRFVEFRRVEGFVRYNANLMGRLWKWHAKCTKKVITIKITYGYN